MAGTVLIKQKDGTWVETEARLLAGHPLAKISDIWIEGKHFGLGEFTYEPLQVIYGKVQP